MNAHQMWLLQSDVDRIEAMLAEHPILTEENLREIATMQLRNVLGHQKLPPAFPANRRRATLYLVLPLCGVLACFIVLASTCYPSKVFLWGDEISRHAKIDQRRKTLWGIIGTVTVGGFLSKLLYDGLTQVWK